MREPHPPIASPWQLAEGQDEGVMWLAWLVRLRWIAIVAQIVTLSFTFRVLDRPVVVVPVLLAAVAALAAANALAIRRVRTGTHVPPEHLLLHLMVDIGEPEPRSIVAGIAEAYEPETIVGRKIVIVANLEPRKLRGLVSQGMVVAASAEGGKPALVGFHEDAPVGARLR